jgi:hypothetical protein
LNLDLGGFKGEGGYWDIEIFLIWGYWDIADLEMLGFVE